MGQYRCWCGATEEEIEYSWTQGYLWYLSHRGRAKASRPNSECQVLPRQHRRRGGGAHGELQRVLEAASFSSSWVRLCGWLCRNLCYAAAQGNSTQSLSPSTLQVMYRELAHGQEPPIPVNLLYWMKSPDQDTFSTSTLKSKNGFNVSSCAIWQQKSSR